MVLTVGSDCSGIEAIIQALKRLKIKHEHLFSSEIDKYAKQSIMYNYQPKNFYDDIMKRNNRDKFIELTEKRVTKTLDSIRLIGNLSDKRYYDYDEKDVKQIFRALSKELSASKNRFSDALKKNKDFKIK